MPIISNLCFNIFGWLQGNRLLFNIGGKPINFSVFEFSNHYCAIRYLEIYKMKLYDCAIAQNIMKFTKEEEENNTSWQCLTWNWKTTERKRISNSTSTTKTPNTNIKMKKRSNHRERIKRGVSKEYSDRAKIICDEPYLEEELRDLEEIFVENEYTKKEVREAI